ncbi:zinc-dependent alcohol dehydrogenase [Rhizobium laguerreae]|uniref:zinc-dependent alcohol dehydrogenase n=1 Tax=Rhizobium laguerreae TaxID=1076926 RepID=UPI001C90A221|nr:alcohol dehydrogenase catalytic domain-containing protein [Rhizobium laguerreae]MBY3381801.1 alcohol dehydrogenase catalytic domain-containing protein [Rhizobium laguerreae]
MKAIALNENNVLAIFEVPDPVVGEGEVKIKMLSAGVCGSDLSSIASGVERAYYPWTIGHEGGGRIVEVGPGVTTLAVGDIVVVEPNYTCMKCKWCLTGQTKMCYERQSLGGQIPGLFSEYFTAPAEYVFKLPAETPKAVLASFEPTAVAYSGVDKYMPADGKSALVIGAGSQGIVVCRRLLDNGIAPYVIEPKAENMAMAVAIGAKNATELEGQKFDLVFETSGAASGYLTALELCERQGDICLIGQTSSPVTLGTRPLVQKELTVKGHLIYNHPTDFSIIAKHVCDGCYQLDGLREFVGPGQGVQDILNARNLGGKIVMDLENWG